MFAKIRYKFSDPFIVLFSTSGVLSIVAYTLSYFVPAHPFSFLVWIILGPIVFLISWAPPVFFFLFVYWPLSRLFYFLPRWRRRTVGIALTFLVLISVPLWVRDHFESNTVSMISGDKVTPPELHEPRILALVATSKGAAKIDPRHCGDFCQRVLINKIADGVAIFRTQLLPDTLQSSLRGTLYRIVRRSTCPEISYSRAKWIRVPDEPRRHQVRGDEILKQGAAQGNCVVAEEITLSQADFVIATGLAKSGIKSGRAGFNLFADTVSAKRIQVYEKRNEALQETFRRTHVTAQLPVSPLTLAFNMKSGSSGVQLVPGFLRFEAHLAGPLIANINHFLLETLDLDLRLRTPLKARAHSEHP